jgi:hypothetical protein
LLADSTRIRQLQLLIRANRTSLDAGKLYLTTNGSIENTPETGVSRVICFDVLLINALSLQFKIAATS